MVTDLQLALDALVDTARFVAQMNSQNWEKHRAAYTPYAYKRMFDTIKLNFGRGVGHSTHIHNNAQDGDLVIYRDAWQMDNEKRLFKNKPLIVRIANLINTRGHDIKGNVWVDTASILSKHEEETIHAGLEPLSNIKQIIMLG